MSQNSCQPEGLQPESAMAALLVLAIERLLPSPGALPSPILAATHACFIMLGTLSGGTAEFVKLGAVKPTQLVLRIAAAAHMPGTAVFPHYCVIRPPDLIPLEFVACTPCA